MLSKSGARNAGKERTKCESECSTLLSYTRNRAPRRAPIRSAVICVPRIKSVTREPSSFPVQQQHIDAALCPPPSHPQHSTMTRAQPQRSLSHHRCSTLRAAASVVAASLPSRSTSDTM